MGEVELIASGYEWTCPDCNTENKEIAIKEKVTCSECKKEFRVGDCNHARW